MINTTITGLGAELIPYVKYGKDSEQHKKWLSIKLLQDSRFKFDEDFNVYEEYKKIHKVDFKVNTDGKGYWSDKKKTVRINKIIVENNGYDLQFYIYFDKKTWDINKDGLIYTDNTFEKEIEEKIKSLGYTLPNFSYSEQGAQGSDNVHCVWNGW